MLEAQKVQEEITKEVEAQSKEQDKITNAIKEQGNFSKIITSGTKSFASSQFQSMEILKF